MLTFPVFLPEHTTAGCAAQLKPLASPAATGSVSPILGIANFEATLELADHTIALGSEDARSAAQILHVADDLVDLRGIFS